MRDQFGRLDWDTTFLSLCYVIAERSIDQHTKHGCVVVDDDRNLLSVGYNGPPRGSIDKLVPLTRPAKYSWLSHAEDNAIINAARNGVSLKGCTFYITGHPCERCFGHMVSVGVKKIIYASRKSHCVTEETKNVISLLKTGHDIEMVEVPVVPLQEVFDAVLVRAEIPYRVTVEVKV